MGFMVLIPNNDRGHPIDGASEKGQEYQVVRIFGKDNTILLALLISHLRCLPIQYRI
jgi:hypothetical protein